MIITGRIAKLWIAILAMTVALLWVTAPVTAAAADPSPDDPIGCCPQ